MCEVWDKDNETYKVKVKNKFYPNTDIEVISPSEKFVTQAVEIKNKDGELLEYANTNDELFIKFRDEIDDYKYAIIRTVGIKNNDN